jgi:broad specificity phosphatase PhoE
MQFYFVRHGQSMGNMANDYSTSAHDQLSPNGWQQAKQLKFAIVYHNSGGTYANRIRSRSFSHST